MQLIIIINNKKGGIGYEEAKTGQMNGEHNSGDGTVNYASLIFCKTWQKQIEESNKSIADVSQHQHMAIHEVPNAHHRYMLYKFVVFFFIFFNTYYDSFIVVDFIIILITCFH